MNEAKYPISDKDMLELLKKYPFLKYRYFWKPTSDDVYSTDQDNIAHNHYKIWDGTGWEDLWKNRYLPRLFKEYDSWDKKTQASFYFTDIKEKFGELRIYTSFTTGKRLESIAEWLSGFTCQHCGAEPRTADGYRTIWTTGGWITHLCRDCARKELINNNVATDKIEEKLDNMQNICKHFGCRQYGQNKIILVTYKETEDGWLEKADEAELNAEDEKRAFIAALKGE